MLILLLFGWLTGLVGFWDRVSLWAQAGLKPKILLSAGITGVYHHAWLHLFLSHYCFGPQCWCNCVQTQCGRLRRGVVSHLTQPDPDSVSRLCGSPEDGWPCTKTLTALNPQNCWTDLMRSWVRPSQAHRKEIHFPPEWVLYLTKIWRPFPTEQVWMKIFLEHSTSLLILLFVCWPGVTVSVHSVPSMYKGLVESGIWNSPILLDWARSFWRSNPLPSTPDIKSSRADVPCMQLQSDQKLLF
jgi:hypothetical protein